MHRLSGWLKQHGFSLLIWGSVAFFTLLYLSLIFNDNLWTDEVFTMLCLRAGGLEEITRFTAIDVHPPLYYYYAKLFFTLFPDSVQAQKIAVILPVTLTFVYGATRIRRHFGDRTALFFILFLACIPCSMEFAVQIRMYSPALMCVTICGTEAYLAYAAEDRRRRMLHFAAYTLALVGAAYLHYFSFMAVIWIGVFLFLAILVRKRTLLPYFAAATLLQVAAYLPWMPYAWQQVTSRHADFWIPPVTAEDIPGYVRWTFGLHEIPYVEYLFLILLAGCAVLLIVRLAARRSDSPRIDVAGLLAMLVPLCTFAAGYVLSVMPGKSAIYRDQYIFPALGMLALFFGIALRRVKLKIGAAVLAFLLFTGAVQYREVFRQEYRSTLLNETRACFAENIKEDDLLIYNWETYGFIYKYVFRDYEVRSILDVDWETNERRIFLMDGASYPMPGGDYFWSHYTIEIIGHYGIEHSEFDLYRIERIAGK